MPRYNNININVNSSNLLCESANLSQDSAQKGLYILGNGKPFDNSSSNVKDSLSLSYFIETKNDPNYLIVSGWKQATTGNLQAIITMGNILFTGYLSSYNFNLAPNNAVKAQATYSLFNELTGKFSNQSNDLSTGFSNIQNGSGIAHYWSSTFQSGQTDIINNNILQLGYSFSAEIQPSYSIGKIQPSQISTLSANETIDILSESQFNIMFSGNKFSNLFSNISNLKLKNISSIYGDNLYQMDFPLIEFNVQTEKLDASLNNLILFNSNYIRYY